MKKLLFFLFTFCGIAGFAQQDGDLDTSFGNNGIVITNLGEGSGGKVYCQKLQSDGKILLAGAIYTTTSAYVGAPSKGFIMRFNADGTPDMSFNANGQLISRTEQSFNALGILSNGQIIAGGYNRVYKLNPDGSFDNSFTDTAAVSSAYVAAIGIQSSQKIVVLYQSWDFGGTTYPNCIMKRLQPNGVLDTTFANMGSISFNTGQSRPLDLILRSNDEIVIGYNYSWSPGAAGGYEVRSYSGEGVSLNSGLSFYSNPNSRSVNALCNQTDGKALVALTNGLFRYTSNFQLDTSFGNNGFINPIPNTIVRKIALQPDGKILALYNYYSYDVNNNYLSGNCAVYRYNTNGNLDATFNGTGSVAVTIVPSDPGVDMGIINSKIVVSSNTVINGVNNSMVTKINLNGSLDTAFDTDGKILINLPSKSNDNLQKTIVQADGKILVAGDNRGSNVSIVRYNSNGSIDTGFANQGIFSLASYSSDRIDFDLQNDGKIIVIYRNPNDSYSNTLVRLNQDGNVDTSFGNNGHFIIPSFLAPTNEPFWSRCILTKIKVFADNKILLGGIHNSYYNYGDYNATGSYLLIKLNSDLSFDTSFNTYGYSIFRYGPNSGSENVLVSLEIQNNDKIFIGGFSGYSTTVSIVAKLNQDGTKDLTYGTDGYYPLPTIWNRSCQITSLYPQGTDKLIVVKSQPTYSYQPPFNDYFSILRLNADGTLDTSFGNAGEIQTTIENASTPTSVKVLPNQKILVAGYSTNSTTSSGYDGNRNFALALYTNDGQLDTPFGNLGTVTTNLNTDSDMPTSIVLTNDNNLIISGTTINPFYGNGDFGLVKYHFANALGNPENIYKHFIFYPNPTKDKIMFTKTVKSVTIYTIDGKMIDGRIENESVDVSNLSKGVYILKVMDENGAVFTEKLTKE